jgi:hypothetical protein
VSLVDPIDLHIDAVVIVEPPQQSEHVFVVLTNIGISVVTESHR